MESNKSSCYSVSHRKNNTISKAQDKPAGFSTVLHAQLRAVVADMATEHGSNECKATPTHSTTGNAKTISPKLPTSKTGKRKKEPSILQ